MVLSCNKTPDTPEFQEVVFQASTESTGLKASCDNPSADFALIQIDETTYQVDVFYLDGQIYTNTLKLSPGNHVLKMFVLVNDGGSPDNPDGDIIVQAAPLSGNTYAHFVSSPLPFSFTVDAFIKSEIPVELLCYEASEYDNFGFAWFSVNEITVREFCFFGDFCTADYQQYTGSLYEYQRNGLQHDMPAIFSIDVYRNDQYLLSYSNEEWFGEGRPLCVQYPDYSNFTDHFKFVLKILVQEGSDFVYKEFYTWETTDAEALPNMGSDNIMDFVLGDCVPDADLVLPPYTNTNPSDDQCSDCQGKISALTLQYVGTETNPEINITDKDHNILFNQVIDNNTPFSFTGVGNNNEMTNEISLSTNNVFNISIHTSCSKPVLIGMQFGDFVVLAGESSEGGSICSLITQNPTPFTGEETAFAYGGDKAICFLEDPDAPNNSRWGWTNGKYKDGDYNLELWAGAADCDQTKGYYVGSVFVSLHHGEAQVTYNIVSQVNLQAVHLYIGKEKYPLNGINSTVAPGKFTFIDDDASDGIDTHITISGLPKDVYIIAHADVYGNY